MILSLFLSITVLSPIPINYNKFPIATLFSYIYIYITWQEMGPGLFQRHYALCDGVLVYIQVSWSLVLFVRIEI